MSLVSTLRRRGWHVYTFAVLMLLTCICTRLVAIDLKMATEAPLGSPWDNALRELAGTWSEISDGEVRLKIYAGGIVGDEPDMLRKIRIGQLDGAAFSQLALASILPEIMAVSTPYLVQTIEEFRYLIAALTPEYERRLLERGLVAISWAEGGWAHFFAVDPIAQPADLLRLKLAVPAGDDEMLQIWRRLGYSAFPLSLTEYAMGLQTGMVEAFYAPPAAVAAFGWFGRISYMNVVPIAPVIGAVVLTTEAWDSISEEHRAAFIESAHAIGRNLTEAAIDVEQDAIDVMIEQGIKVVESQLPAEWWELGISGAELAQGRLFSSEEYEKVVSLLETYRRVAAPVATD